MNAVSVYGPVATAAEWAAAELGGTSLARITFWLKLEEAVAFGAVILALDRLLRADPEMRLRAPAVVGEPAAALGDRRGRPYRRPGRRVRPAGNRGAAGAHLARGELPGGGIQLGGAVLAALLIGVATGIKVEYALLGLDR